ncbi:uncharacterized protein LOC144177783 [Haemaphysalis longicornis]
MSRAVILSVIAAGCFIINVFMVLENSQSLALVNRLRLAPGRESASSFRGLAALAVVLYVTVFSHTLGCIATVIFICSQCTRNRHCVRVFLAWSGIDIFILSVCDVALYYLVQSVVNEGYRALQSTMQATEEYTTQTSDYVEGGLMDKYPSDPDDIVSDDTTTEGSKREESYPVKVIGFTGRIHSRSSLSEIVLFAIFKILVLSMIKQYADVEDVGEGSSVLQSSSTESRIASLRAAYERHRTTFLSNQERVEEDQAHQVGVNTPTLSRTTGETATVVGTLPVDHVSELSKLTSHSAKTVFSPGGTLPTTPRLHDAQLADDAPKLPHTTADVTTVVATLPAGHVSELPKSTRKRSKTTVTSGGKLDNRYDYLMANDAPNLPRMTADVATAVATLPAGHASESPRSASKRAKTAVKARGDLYKRQDF